MSASERLKPIQPVAGTGKQHKLGSDLKRVLKPAMKKGWVVEMTRSLHLRIYHPDQPENFVIMSSTPSDIRALKNLRADLRRAGAPTR